MENIIISSTTIDDLTSTEIESLRAKRLHDKEKIRQRRKARKLNYRKRSSEYFCGSRIGRPWKHDSFGHWTRTYSGLCKQEIVNSHLKKDIVLLKKTYIGKVDNNNAKFEHFEISPLEDFYVLADIAKDTELKRLLDAVSSHILGSYDRNEIKYLTIKDVEFIAGFTEDAELAEKISSLNSYLSTM